ncbi:MAG TPA: glycosyltransferase family 4 protein [Candidatus Eremiobacteraeota bacterium]|nr:MAG: Alpha-monoglucosyldiacylglycerol synthase [bacterium ADurb.Bin363]HPZ08932.1 glycosyltransferase family 4 protein [Candidatus Eremiobacteraeota bacterium]
MNIGIFTDAYTPVVNGVVNAIENLHMNLLSLNHKIYIFAPGYPGYKDDCSNIYRFKSIILSKKVNYPVSIPYSRSIFNTINNLSLDIIHCHHPFLLGRLGLYFARRLKIPLVGTFHTQYESYIHYIPFNRYFIKKLTLWALKDFASNCDVLIIPAESRKEQLEHSGISGNIRVIPNGIKLEQFNKLNGKRVREIYSISPEDKLLIFVGRLAKEKNLDFLLECFEYILEQFPSVKLMLVGDGPESKRLITKTSKFTEKVILTGQIKHEDIGDYYGAADVFVSASTTEVHPIVLLEAMTCGLPVVAISSIGYKDTIISGIDGLLCRENVKDFSEAVLLLLKDKFKRYSIIQNARKKVERYSINTTTRQIIDVYSSLLKK